MNKNNFLYMGIDGGGTKCRVCIQSPDGKVLGVGLGGSANPTYGMDLVSDSIMNATHEALKAAGLGEEDVSRLIVGAGLGGLHLPRFQKLANDWQHPFKALYLTNDLITATLGAHNGEDGALIIVGTGFSASAVVNSVEHNIGGFGFALGETCSGYWIGHEAIQQVLKAYDSLGEPTVLTQLLANEIGGVGYELADKISHFSIKDFAAITPLVFTAAAQNDEVAQRIIEQSVSFTARVAEKLLSKGTNKLSLVGGVANQIAHLLPQHIQACIVEPTHQPEVGAIFYAHKKCAIDFI